MAQEKETIQERLTRIGANPKKRSNCGFFTFTLNPVVVKNLKEALKKKGVEVDTDFEQSKLIGMRRIFEVTLRSVGYSNQEADKVLGEWEQFGKFKK